MGIQEHLGELGFSPNEIACYLSLLPAHPLNGSQLSRLSGVSRSKVYDILRKMAAKGLVAEVAEGLYSPLPPEELTGRLRRRFETSLRVLEDHLKENAGAPGLEFIWTLRGHEQVLGKARQMIAAAKASLPAAGPLEGGCSSRLAAAAARGVSVKYVALGPIPAPFALRVIHPEHEKLPAALGGRACDLIVDRAEALVGVFPLDPAAPATANWSRNPWFVVSSRDSLRHDFYHYFLHKTYDRGERLSPEEEALYRLIKADA